MAIHVLSEHLASQIAAGEVVERPASVVKELLENALDAGARTINIDVRDGGRRLIQVADDGVGIAAGEIDVAFLRHATSKLQTAEDLAAIHTLGFRGEALAAIAAVSRVTIASRTADEKAGTRLILEGGRTASWDTVGAPQGTVIAVENLFFNVPARLKFLKSESTEKRVIDELVTRYALAYPEVRFRLAHNNRITFQTTGQGRVEDVLLEIYGPETARQLLPLQVDDDQEPAHGIAVSGFAGPPSLHWANRSHITLFANGRWIRDNSLTYAVIQAYHTLLPTGRYPLGVIFIELLPEEVDVNVHPTKIEVRFRRSNAVFSAVQRAVRHTLVADSPVRSMSVWATGTSGEEGLAWGSNLGQQDFSRREDASQDAFALDWARRNSEPIEQDGDNLGAMGAETQGTLPGGSQNELLGGERLPIMRVVGQVGAAYIITEGPEGMFLIDQHAAHERILYEKFMAAWAQEGSVATQHLVAGAAVHLSPAQARLLEDQLPVLEKAGFTVEPFGPNAFMVRSIPALVMKLDPAKALTSVVEDLERGDEPLQGKIEARIILRVCKTAAIKAGQTLSMAEMEALVEQLEACHSPHTCPHGRPTLIHLSVAQLAKQFGRT